MSRLQTFVIGRLVGVILELTKGHQLLIVSAYMPTGLDHRSPSDESVQTAHNLYQEMMTWTRGVQRIVFMGDLNETLTSYDRHPRLAPVGSRAAAAATPSPIQCLVDEGFTDVYRLLHPDAKRQPGFTHFIDSTTQCSRSRVDYIWTRGASAASHLDIRIDAKLRDISHHRLVWMDLHLQREPSPPCDRPLYCMKLPNLRDLSPEQQEVFVDHLEKRTMRQEHHLRTLADTLSSSSLSSLAIELTT
jgi:hypothetical protein